MHKRCLIISCFNTPSGALPGAWQDARNYIRFLLSDYGGSWYENELILLKNPTQRRLVEIIDRYFKNLDYSLIIFSGHGFFNRAINMQCVELLDSSMPISKLNTRCIKQNIIIDSCRNYSEDIEVTMPQFYQEPEAFIGDVTSVRMDYENAIRRADKGISVFFSSSQNQSSIDTPKGGLYSIALLQSAELWISNNTKSNVVSINYIHDMAKKVLIDNHFNQMPAKNIGQRKVHFPFATKPSNEGYSLKQ